MDQFLAQDINPADRADFLRDNCDSVEEIWYTHKFSQEELQEKKENLANICIDIADVAEAKKAAMDAFKVKQKPLDEKKSTLLTDIKRKAVDVKDECFKFLDHDKRMVGYYNGDGELVDSRPMRAQEMQKTIFSISKTGTDD